MREYTIKKVASSDIDWAKIPVLNIDNHQWTEKTDICATAQIAYDETAIYAYLTAKEKAVLARYTTQTSPVWTDSCLEFFFCPIEGDLRYFDFESNPNGSTFVGFGRNSQEILRLVTVEAEKSIVSAETARTEDGWSVLYTIPYDFLRIIVPDFKPTSGMKIRANCYKCGDETEKPHFISWNRINSETPQFHRPQDFGLMIFE